MAGPLTGIRVVELQGRGPGPFGAMVLADLGAEVLRVARREDIGAAEDESATQRNLTGHRRIDLLARGRRVVAIDLKTQDGVRAVLRLIDRADVVIEPFRPGVAERLGVGPDVCLERNPRLVYARITGWGQTGPYASTPGHDLNYVALSGALDPLRARGQPPAPPLNLVGDFGGGGMLLAIGVLGALLERSRSGQGQVVDAAMVDGAALLTTMFHGMRAEGLWSDDYGSNVLDLGAPFYNVYETADGRYVTIASGEPKFYAQLLGLLGLGRNCSSSRRTPPRGRKARSDSQRYSRRRLEMSGASYWRAPTRASPPCSRCGRHPNIRTTSVARPSSASTVSCSPPRPPASAAHRPACTRPAGPGTRRSNSWRNGV